MYTVTLAGLRALADVSAPPRSLSQVYSASLDGTIALWDLGAGSLLQRYTVGEPVESLVIAPGGGGAFVSTHWGGERQAGRVAAFDFDSKGGRLGAERAKTSSPRQLVVSACPVCCGCTTRMHAAQPLLSFEVL